MVIALRIAGRHLAVIGYVILSLAVIGGFFRVEQIANLQQQQIQQAMAERRATQLRFEETAARLATSDERQLSAMRTVLCLARRNTLTSRQRTPEEKAAIAAFYNEALDSIDALPCDPLKEAP